MPYEIIWDLPGVEWRFYGQCNVAELLEASRLVHEDERYGATRYSLLDCTELSQAGVNVLDVVKLAQNDRLIEQDHPHRKIAIVAQQPEVIEVSKIYQWSLAEKHWQVRLFRERHEALQWLNA